MPKDLFVRDFDENLHAEATNIANKEGVTLAAIVNKAIDEWIKKKTRDKHKHDLILYSDENSLKILLSELDKLTKRNWLRVCCGSKNNSGVLFLKDQGWFDATVSPYKEFIEKPNTVGNKIIAKINKTRSDLPFVIVAFLAGDIIREKSLQKAAEFCTWYERKNIPGITHCFCNFKDVFSDIENTFKLFRTHGTIYMARDKMLYKMSISEDNTFSLLV